MIELLAESPVAFIGIVFAFALLFGSFLNVVIYRLPIMMEREWREQCKELAEMPVTDVPDEKFNLVVPRSRCPSCGHPISSLQNIPVVSYLAVRGRCGNCGAGISARYPIIEFVTALLCAIVAWRFGFFGDLRLHDTVFLQEYYPANVCDIDCKLK